MTYKNRMTPVLAIAYASPRIPLPMIAFPKLNTDIPNEVFPSNYNRCKTEERNTHVTYYMQVRCILCRSLLVVFELTSVNRVVFLSSTPDKNSWLSGRLASAFSVLWGLMGRNAAIRT